MRIYVAVNAAIADLGLNANTCCVQPDKHIHLILGRQIEALCMHQTQCIMGIYLMRLSPFLPSKLSRSEEHGRPGLYGLLTPTRQSVDSKDNLVQNPWQC